MAPGVTAGGGADGLPPLRDVLAELGIRGSRHLGQHFIHDLAFLGRLADRAGPVAGADILEIGPGPGGLTRALLAAGARRVVAVERDSRFRPALAAIARHWPDRLEAVFADACRMDATARLRPPARIVANLPYQVAAPLVAAWMSAADWPPVWSEVTILVQREMAERITSPPGSRAYGRLSVLVQWRANARILQPVPASVFLPPPRVESSLLRLQPRLAAESGFPPAVLVAITRAAFGGRRKTLRRSLARLTPASGEWLAAAGVDPGLRADALPVAGYCALARTAAECGVRVG